MKLSRETRSLYTGIVVTAIENPFIDAWDENLVNYAWFYPELDGGSCDPGPGNTSNASATWKMGDGTYKTFDVSAVSKARGIMRQVIADPNAKKWVRESAQYLEDEFKKGYDEADFDAFDAMNVMQFFLFGYPVYG